MEYTSYKTARDNAWRALIQNNITALPVQISKICKADGILLLPYSKAGALLSEAGMRQMMENDGFSLIIANSAQRIKCIFYNDECNVQRQRFTIAHEYGHFLCGHIRENIPTMRNREPSDNDLPAEQQANVVAARILAPACVLWALNVHEAGTIASLCNISQAAAEWRMKRLNLLYDREREFLATRGCSCFLQSPLEREVYSQFETFIKSHK